MDSGCVGEGSAQSGLCRVRSTQAYFLDIQIITYVYHVTSYFVRWGFQVVFVLVRSTSFFLSKWLAEEQESRMSSIATTRRRGAICQEFGCGVVHGI